MSQPVCLSPCDDGAEVSTVRLYWDIPQKQKSCDILLVMDDLKRGMNNRKELLKSANTSNIPKPLIYDKRQTKT